MSTTDNELAESEANTPSLNLLVIVQGEVLLKRKEWSEYHRTPFGTVLGPLDRIRLADDAQAAVLCDDDLSLQAIAADGNVPVGIKNYCGPSEKPVIKRGGVSVSNPRGSDLSIPYIISPRSTDLLTRTPILRWNAPRNADSYIVRIMQGAEVIWEKGDVTQTELVYPGMPQLKPDVHYNLVVETEVRGKKVSSTEEQKLGLDFRLLEETEIEQIQANANTIDNHPLDDEAKAFVRAQFYARQGLTAEAIEILEGLVENGSQRVAVQQSLGDLYAQIGLNLQAEQAYLDALKLKEAKDNLENKTDIQAGLGEIYLRLGEDVDATHYLIEAQAGYEKLGDTEKVNEIIKKITTLK